MISDYIREHQEQIYLFENKKGQASSPGQINRIINYKKNKREKLLPIKNTSKRYRQLSETE
ncbi:MAG: hypothetical protein IPO72_15625 [Saprospiraceae bacterium]|nr:hypothetical protein [Candidatus Vicinibacter affinis]